MKINFLSKSSDQGDFASRTAIVATIAVATVAVSFVLWKLTDLLPAVFATILIALAWRGVAEQVSARLGLSQGLSLAVVALGSFASIVLALMLFGGQLVRQYDEVALDVPAAIALIERTLEEHPWGRFVEKFVVHVDFSKMTTPVAQQFGAVLGSLGNGLAYGIFAIIGAAYLAADPERYAAGLLALTPASRRTDMALFLERSGASLRQWLYIQLYVVAMNAIFAGAALWAFGVPAPLALATISGALAFVPYFGSIIAMIIGVLVASAAWDGQCGSCGACDRLREFHRGLSDHALSAEPLPEGFAGRAFVLHARLRLAVRDDGHCAGGSGDRRSVHRLSNRRRDPIVLRVQFLSKFEWRRREE